MDRFFIQANNFHGDKVVILAEQAHQICSVLRKKASSHIIVLDNRGSEYEIELTTVTNKQVVGHVIEKRQASRESYVELTLYQSLLGREKFEWVLQKCTEVGVKCFVPVITERSLVRNSESVGDAKFQRWQRILKEAAEQSERGKIPQLRRPVEIGKALAEVGVYDHSLIACARQGATSIRKRLNRADASSEKVALFIGPEGGFTDDEIDLALKYNVKSINLGKRILRTETAAVVASTLILYQLGELGI